MIYKLKVFVLLLLLPATIFGQTKAEKRGDKALLKGDYQEAIVQFQNSKDKSASVMRKIAACYFILGNYEASEKCYNSIPEKEKIAADLLQLSQMQLANNNFAAAVLLAERAGELGADPNEVQVQLATVRRWMEFRTNNQQWQMNPIEVQPKGKCLGIFLSPEEIVYSETGTGKLKSATNYKLQVATHKNLVFDSPQAFAGTLESKTDIGAICIAPDGNVMYYTRWFYRRGKQQMEIAIAEKEKGEWKSKESLAFCSRKYSCCYPFLSSDGESMYFASDMEGGYGGMDLYVSEKEGDKWTEPQNLGKRVNTAKNEIYPRMLCNEQLWFSSDGRGGYGELDLFFTSKNEDGTWAPAINPGEPFNSAFSDYAIQDIPNVDVQLLVSDREDNGLRDKIYCIKKEAQERIQLFVKDASTNELITNVHCSVLKALDKESISVEEKGMTDGELSFQLPVSAMDQGILYEIRLKKTGYQDRVVEYYPSSQNKRVEVKLDPINKLPKFSFVSELLPIASPRQKISFQNIYFDKSEADFSEAAKKIMDRLSRFWKEFPELGIKINAHTDSKGSSEKNLNISMKKAEKAKQYLVSKGVEVSAIEVGAWGEAFVLNACAVEEECSEEQHQENRRIELIFVL